MIDRKWKPKKTGLGYKRAQEARVIKKRLKIVKKWSAHSSFFGVQTKHPLEIEPHRLAKFNLNCGCKMCKYYKHIGNKKGKVKFSELKKLNEKDFSAC